MSKETEVDIMRRREFLGGSVSAGILAGSARLQGDPQPDEKDYTSYTTEVTIERPQPGKPHKGKVLAAIQPHCDDIAFFAGGTILKLIDEGYRGVLIQMSNDSMAGAGSSIGDIVLKNERDTEELARRLGLEETYFFNYANHYMDGWPILEMRARLVFLLRLLKVDTVLVYDPWSLYERNPDHYVTASAVEWAAAVAGFEWDYQEHFKAGITPHTVQDRYYFARGPQLVNRVVDISPYMDKKVEANVGLVTQGPGGDNGARLRKRLAAEGSKLPLLGDNDETANREYTKTFALEYDRIRGQAHGLEYAEYFHYVAPEELKVEEYIRKYAVAL